MLFITTIFGCNNKKHYKEKVSCYRVHQQDNSGNDILMYYLLFSSMNNSNYYYYSSPTQITNYSFITWNQSSINPIKNIEEDKIDNLGDKEITTEQFSEEMQSKMENNPENFQGMKESEMGDYEGTETNSSTTSTPNNDEPSTSGEESSGESGDGGGQ